MLNCERVQVGLGLERGGEPLGSDLEQHVQACARCGEARREIAEDLDALRAAWQEMLPCRTLEGDVVAALRARSLEAPPPRLRLILSVAVVAAVLLVVLLLRPRVEQGVAPQAAAPPGPLELRVQVGGPGEVWVDAGPKTQRPVPLERRLAPDQLPHWFLQQVGGAVGTLAPPETGPVLWLEATVDSDWRTVQDVLLAACQLEVGAQVVVFPGAGRDGRALHWPVPRDAGLLIGEPDEQGVRLSILPRAGEPVVRMKIEGTLLDFVWTDAAPELEDLRARLEHLAQRRHAANALLVVKLAPITVRGPLTYAPVQSLLRLCEEVGVDRVLIEAAR